MTILEEGRKFQAKAGIGFGSVKATFVGDAEWVELDAPNRAKVKAHGRAPGSAADVTSEMKLSDAADGGTLMEWTADVAVLGQLASLAARLMGTVSQKLTAVFFDCVRSKIEAGQPSADAQAGWIDQVARLAVCKPFISGVAYAHFADAQPHLFPHLGLQDAEGQPRPALHSLRALRERFLA